MYINNNELASLLKQANELVFKIKTIFAEYPNFMECESCLHKDFKQYTNFKGVIERHFAHIFMEIMCRTIISAAKHNTAITAQCLSGIICARVQKLKSSSCHMILDALGRLIDLKKNKYVAIQNAAANDGIRFNIFASKINTLELTNPFFKNTKANEYKEKLQRNIKAMTGFLRNNSYIENISITGKACNFSIELAVALSRVVKNKPHLRIHSSNDTTMFFTYNELSFKSITVTNCPHLIKIFFNNLSGTTSIKIANNPRLYKLRFNVMSGPQNIAICNNPVLGEIVLPEFFCCGRPKLRELQFYNNKINNPPREFLKYLADSAKITLGDRQTTKKTKELLEKTSKGLKIEYSKQSSNYSPFLIKVTAPDRKEQLLVRGIIRQTPYN